MPSVNLNHHLTLEDREIIAISEYYSYLWLLNYIYPWDIIGTLVVLERYHSDIFKLDFIAHQAKRRNLNLSLFNHHFSIVSAH